MKNSAAIFGIVAMFFLYSCSPKSASHETALSVPQNEKIPYSHLEEIKQSMILMSPSDADDFLIKTIPKIEGGITCDDLVEMLRRVKYSDAARVIKIVAGYVRRPFSENCFSNIANVTESSESAGAIFNLYRSDPTY